MTSAAKKRPSNAADLDRPEEVDPIFAALDRAPIGEPFTPEQRAELDQDLEDIRAGRARLIPHADRARALEELARTQGE